MTTETPGLQMKVWRTRQQVKQGDMARLLNISVSHLAAIEAGKGLPGRALAIKIEDMTGISARDWSSPASECETAKQTAPFNGCEECGCQIAENSRICDECAAVEARR